MGVTLAALIGLIALALLSDFTNGFHDSANAIAALAYWGSTLPPEPLNVVLMGAVLAGLLVVALRRAPSAEDIERETAEEHEVPLRAGAGSLTARRRCLSPARGPTRIARGRSPKEIDQPL